MSLRSLLMPTIEKFHRGGMQSAFARVPMTQGEAFILIHRTGVKERLVDGEWIPQNGATVSVSSGNVSTSGEGVYVYIAEKNTPNATFDAARMAVDELISELLKKGLNDMLSI